DPGRAAVDSAGGKGDPVLRAALRTLTTSMNPLRVGLVHPFSWPEVRRGGERYLADLEWYLAQAGHHVEVITGTGRRSERSVGGRTTYHRLHHLRSNRLAGRGYGEAETFGLRAFPTLVRRRRFDAVHAFTPTAAVAARLAGHRTLYTILGHASTDLVTTLPRESKLIRAAVRRATLVAALSAASAGAAEQAFGRSAEVLPPGVMLDRFPVRPEPRIGPARVLFPAFASNPQKGLGTLVEAFTSLLERKPDARLVLAGPGDHEWAFARLGERATRARASTDILGVGDVADLPARYAASTVTALPSTNEAFGLILLESLACGTPVVSGADGGMPEIVDRPDVGRTIPFGDAPALARALEQTIALAADPDTPARCREHARRWGWKERVGPMHEEIYRRLADAGRRESQPPEPSRNGRASR
ncbi:MAG: glycosyltransferase family 4 protein, partial [Actinomycetota bacterium]